MHSLLLSRQYCASKISGKSDRDVINSKLELCDRFNLSASNISLVKSFKMKKSQVNVGQSLCSWLIKFDTEFLFFTLLCSVSFRFKFFDLSAETARDDEVSVVNFSKINILLVR
jgi:hypothetical protein